MYTVELAPSPDSILATTMKARGSYSSRSQMSGANFLYCRPQGPCTIS